VNQVNILNKTKSYLSYFNLGYASAGPKGESGPPGRDGKKI